MTFTKAYQWISLVIIAFIVLTVNVFRFIDLDKSPPGFHVDELSGSVTVQCLAEEGIDAHDHRYPLFGELNYGSPKPPTYMYPAVLWTKIFGYSISSFRAFSGFIAILSIIGLFFLAKQLFSLQAAYWIILTASISPFVFQISRIALEAGLAPCFIIWGLYFFTRSDHFLNAVLTGILFALAMYSYPPARLFIPLLFLPMLYLRWSMGKVNLKMFSLTFLVMAVILIPLITGTIRGQYMTRFNEIGIFSEEFLASSGKSKNWSDLSVVFIRNYLTHLNSDFLFFSGDKNYVYSTGHFGILSWLDSIALLCGLIILIFYLFQWKAISRRQSGIMVFLIMALILSIVPSALTWEDIPHSLRIICGWPFLVLLTGFILFKITELVSPFRYVFLGLACAFILIYGKHYFFVYPKQTYYMFSSSAKVEALAAKTNEDWLKFIYRYRHQNFHLRYYLMNYLKGQNCSSTQALWKEVHKIQ
ncbi:MAG: glycosyltransferase family 39 protein [Candidatus Omnitrophica bacterium]|nr:glycosyltransferase family 39 protein [Candidatus Omnitrophota bacterium]